MKGSVMNKFMISLIIGLVFLSCFATQACDIPELSQGQTIYVPAYSHIYHSSDERPFYLTITLSIRNTDPNNSITITKVDYHETKGKLIVKHLDSAIVLGPYESLRYVIPENDKSGGSGANFIVKWEAEKCINKPIVETIMVSTRGQQGLSFTSRGQAIVDSK